MNGDNFVPLVDLGRPSQAWRGANGSLMEKHFTTLETDFTLVTLLPLRKVTLSLETSFLLYEPVFCNRTKMSK